MVGLNRKWFVILALGCLLALAACSSAPATANLPNPASAFCQQNGGKLEIRTDKSGGQYGVCVFADKSECDEWAFFRGECKPGDSLKPALPGAANLPNPASAFCLQNGGKLEIRTDKSGGQYGVCVFADKSECDEWAFFRGECKPGGWLSYHSPKLGYTFQYPPDAKLEAAPDGGSVTISGPLVANEHWPVIFFNHPQRADAAPAPNANLEQWLKTNNLLVGERRADAVIAGGTAVHLRQNTGPQAYNADSFYFAHGGQLYSVVFLHTGGKEDWALYNRLLESIRFEK